MFLLNKRDEHKNPKQMRKHPKKQKPPTHKIQAFTPKQLKKKRETTNQPKQQKQRQATCTVFWWA